jgi:uncharacterized membrane protein YccC
MFLFRYFGPANYGIFVIILTALVVLLAAVAGIAPKEAIAERAANTAVGGALALLAYWLWPSWERTQVSEAMAAMLEAYRNYFHAVTGALPGRSNPLKRDRTRLAARLARSNMEASIDRLGGEPGTPPEQLRAFSAMLASSHAFAHAAISLEAALGSPGEPGEELRAFARDVERTLEILAARLRGSKAESTPPDLREDHRRLVKSSEALAKPHALVDVEADRITNSLNTLREQVEKMQKSKN